jgi:hypothetical protein
VTEATDPTAVGVGPYAGPPPTGDHWDPELLGEGDRRNVVDRYRYWRHEAIVADLDTRRHPFHVAVENWGHDFNIGSVMRTANAFNAAAFHIVGKPPLEPPGRHGHRSLSTRASTIRTQPRSQPGPPHAGAPGGEGHGIPIIGIDNVPGSVALETYDLPRECVLVFGQEGPRAHARDAAGMPCGAAHRAVRLHALDQRGGRGSHRHARVGATPRLRPKALTAVAGRRNGHTVAAEVTR